MTATAERTNRDNLLAMLDLGQSVDFVRFILVSADGEIQLSAYVDDEYAERPFMHDAVTAIERRFPALEEYADKRAMLGEVAVVITRTPDGRYFCKARAKVYDRKDTRSLTRLERVIDEIAAGLAPIFDAAADAGDLP